jgi:UDP-N-acetylglucosamine 2-epimerase (non-hydrolysing)
MKKKIAIIFGTRPDTIKLAPVIVELQRQYKKFDIIPIATAQHRSMLDQVLNVFAIEPRYDLNVMKPNQSLAMITKNIIGALDDVLVKEQPDMIVVQGDTSTTFVGSLAAFYRHIPVAHVEAGLRTNNKNNPFPEEINRRLTTCIADLHFAPTDTSKKALLREHVNPASVFITGNTVIDALHTSVRQKYNFSYTPLNIILQGTKRRILITMHRRENWGAPMQKACIAVQRLSKKYPDIDFIFPVHLNPIVREIVHPILSQLPNVLLIEPLDYLDFVNTIARVTLVLTDSGGVQEEAPSLGKPVLVLRSTTERPEAVKYGTAKLVGLNEELIYSSTCKLLNDPKAYKKMATATNPYGDGLASKRITAIIGNYFGLSKKIISEFIPH